MPSLSSLFFSSHGRLGRRAFWSAAFGLIVANLMLSVMPMLGAVCTLLMLWPWTCLLIKRLHDQGRSGALAMVPVALSAASGMLSMMAGVLTFTPGGAGLPVLALLAPATGVLGLTGLAFLIWVGAARSQFGANRYGPSRAASPAHNLFKPH